MRTYYIDGARGSDSNDGLTASTPWASVANILSGTFYPGVRFLFRRGQTYAGARIVVNCNASYFGAYGTELTRPVLTGVVTGTNDFIFWVGAKNDITIENLTLRNGESGVRVDAGSRLVVRNCEFYDQSSQGIQCSNAGTPAGRHLVEGCHFQGIKTDAVGIYGSHKLDCRYCTFLDIGNDDNVAGGGPGDATTTHDTSQMTVEFCRMEDCEQGAGAFTSTGPNIFRNNLAINCWSFGVQQTLGGSCVVSNSIFVDDSDHTAAPRLRCANGSTMEVYNCGFYQYRTGTPSSRMIDFSSTTGNTMTVKNCIFWLNNELAGSTHTIFQGLASNTVVFDYNIYDSDSLWDALAFTAWQGTGQDTNSVIAYPNLRGGADLHSPAAWEPQSFAASVGTGLTIGTISAIDFFGNTRSGTWTIGPIQYFGANVGVRTTPSGITFGKRAVSGTNADKNIKLAPAPANKTSGVAISGIHLSADGDVNFVIHSGILEMRNILFAGDLGTGPMNISFSDVAAVSTNPSENLYISFFGTTGKAVSGTVMISFATKASYSASSLLT